MIMCVRFVASIGAVLLLLAGCSSEEKKDANADHAEPTSSVGVAATKSNPVRTEFIIVREIVKQHDLQAGNEKRVEAIETALRTRFPLLPDKGNTEEEKRIFRLGKDLLSTIDGRKQP